MGNLDGLSNVTTAAGSLGALILATPQLGNQPQNTVGYQPQNAPSDVDNQDQQPPTLVFDYEAEQSVTLETDITDHYIEDNSAIQDNATLKPIMITTGGFIGELSDVLPIGNTTLKQLRDSLVAISSYTPQLTEAALVAYNEAFFLYQTGASLANAAVSAWGSVTGNGGTNVIDGEGQITSLPNQTRQQLMFQQFFGYYNSRTLFTVQTPWAIFEDMIIKTLRAVQDADTQMVTSFEITFKQMRFAQTVTVAASNLIDYQDSQERLRDMAQPEFAGGTQTAATPAPVSLTGSVTNITGAA